MTWYSRRKFLTQLTKGGTGILLGNKLQGIIVSQKAPSIIPHLFSKPQIPFGVSSGDIHLDRGVLWSKTDRPAKMMVEWATNEQLKNPTRIIGPLTNRDQDFTSKVFLEGLPRNQSIFYRVKFQDHSNPGVFSEPVTGFFQTPPTYKTDIRFCWSGDTAGQGWGINPDWGGMRIYRAMHTLMPDFFIHSGDTIYADQEIQAEVSLKDGGIWKNVVTEAKSKVAESLDEFRGNYGYNLLDKNIRDFNANIPIYYQWDDHEVVNNWYPGEILDDDRYTEKRVDVLAQHARKAFLEYTPIHPQGNKTTNIFRHIPYGPSLDIFFLDMRSFRGPNSSNRQMKLNAESALLGSKQVKWLKKQLERSKATWKVIASDMPIGLIVGDYNNTFENCANGDGRPLGREMEIASLLGFIKKKNIQNVVWLTADVHYTAAHHYHPNRAVFQDFLPFYEFVSGPLNSGTFGPGKLDNTFGPEVKFFKAPPFGEANLPPSAGMQFFGYIKIDGKTEVMTVSLRDVDGEELYSMDIDPVFD